MTSMHYMAHQPRVSSPPPFFSLPPCSFAILLTITHLICHKVAAVAVVSPSRANQTEELFHLNASFIPTPQSPPPPPAGLEWQANRHGRNGTTLVILNTEGHVDDLDLLFKEYLHMFNITFHGDGDVDFLRGEGLSTLLWQAENSEYSRVMYVLDRRNSNEAGSCDMGESLSQAFNKTIIVWPCPKMEHRPETPENTALPSLETVAVAVKSISQEFNWTEAVIFVAGTNWGLPLAIAANLHVPYRIEFNYMDVGQIEDKLGAAVIITSHTESIVTRRLLRQFRSLVYTKVMVVDITGEIFSRRNHFAGYLTTKEELEYIAEHWSENEFYSTDRNSGQQRQKRSADPRNTSSSMSNEDDDAGRIPEESDKISLEADLESLDPKPQNFLILTILTEKLKTFHNSALHVEFEQYYKLSRSGIVQPLEMGHGASGDAEEGEAATLTGQANSNNEYPLHQRKQIKRSEEIIVSVNGTRNCNTANEEHTVTASAAKANAKGGGPRAGDCGDNNGAGGRLLISKLPIFTSLTSSINESIQLLLVYTGQKNCTLSRVGSGKASAADQEQLLSECVSALKCSAVADANEQLFCSYLCKIVLDNSVKSEESVANRSDVIEEVSRRFESPAHVVATVEQICEQQSEWPTLWSGGVQMQFSANLLYFYNENVVSKNNELVKRHKSNPMPIPLTQKTHYATKDSPLSGTTSQMRRSKRDDASSRPMGDNQIAVNGLQRPQLMRLRDDPEDDEKVSGAKTESEAQVERRSDSATAASEYAKYHELFSLFDSIVSLVKGQANPKRFDFIILDFQNGVMNSGDETGFSWRPLLIMQQSLLNPKVFTTHSILPGYNDWTLVPTQNFMDCGLLCMGVIALAILILCSIVVGGVVSAITIRNYLLKKRLSKGPNKVVLAPGDFVFPVDSRRVDEGIEAMLCCFLQQLQEFGGPEVDKPDNVKGSMNSLKNAGITSTQNKNTSGSGSLARHNTVLDMRARYNGDLVQLKEIAMLTGTELKTKAMDHLVMAHGLRHENINPFIGWLSDSNRTAMVFEYCSRGSLQDVLIMDDIKLDWSFRLSLLTDLVRGMRYLHSSPLRVHGRLTSRNCVVDARWVLKITDYGMSSFYDTIGLPPPTKSAKELLWTAPEALRNTKGFPKCGTQMGDVYSFGIIMQEVVVRGEPYCMLSLSPEEIIAKIKKPPPLIRPSVSKGAAPPEAINIMRQCWAETPDMRPDFNTVYERFKQLNHGRKVNFVDTMFQMLEKYSNNLEELIRERTDQLDMERKKTEQLLNRMLPATVAEKLKVGLGVEPEEFGEVTIYFSDIVGFTTIAAHCSPVQVVDLLNDLYTCFDATINAYHVYKVETIGDAYMVVSGLPSRIPDHAEQIATMALDLLYESGRFRIKHLPGVPLQLRIGLHTGPCCAGVVGLTMPRYCLFGDTVNTASRMESTGSSWRIHLSQSTNDRLVAAGGYYIDSRGLIDIKGKGMMNTYWLLGKKGFDKPLPVPPPIGESHGLDDSLIRNSIRTSQLLEQQSPEAESVTVTSTTTRTKSDAVEVKVEITPPVATNTEQPLSAAVESSPAVIPTSMSLDSTTSQTTLSFSQQDFPPRASMSLASPQQRKMSEFSQDSLLNPSGFTRMTPSPGANSSRLFKKIEEMMDLSSPYNHYRCLSSESNLVQCGGNMLGLGSALQNLATLGGNLSVPSPAMLNFSTSLNVPDAADKLNATKTSDRNGGTPAGGGVLMVDASSRPGSGRLLRRQFSLDKDDVNNNNSAAAASLSNNLGNSACLQAVGKSKSYAESSPADAYQKHSSLPSISGQTLINKLQQTANKTPLFKHNSSSISQDLEKIEEVPGSPSQPLTFSGPRVHRAPYSQSSLTNSIPFIDGSCSSSVSTIPSSGVTNLNTIPGKTSADGANSASGKVASPPPDEVGC